jgi:hypothetical protein
MKSSQAWRGWAMGLKQDIDNRCNHGCNNALPPSGHVVSLFIDALWSDSCVQKSPVTFLAVTFSHHQQVWNNATFRKMAFDIMVAIGVNITLDEDNLGMNYFHLAAYLGQAIFALEQYDGNGDIAIFKAVRVLCDFRGGGPREFIRFFLKRISCSCLKAKYSMIKKSLPIRMSECFTCKQSKELRSLMLCERCKSIQYCCKECQVADWSIHKGLCKVIHAYEMKKYR